MSTAYTPLSIVLSIMPPCISVIDLHSAIIYTIHVHVHPMDLYVAYISHNVEHCIPKNYTLTFIMIIEEAKVMRTKIMALNQWCYMHVVTVPIHSTCIDCSWSVNSSQIFIHFPQLSPIESWIDDSNFIGIGFNIDLGWIRLQIRKCLW